MPLSPKVFSILLILVENGGSLVDKEVLMESVWPETFVEEASLTKNISLLRKALADLGHASVYIETVPKRGYRFVATVERVEERWSESLVTKTASFGSVKRNVVLTALGCTVIAAVGLGAWFYARSPSKKVRIKSIAVMPFVNEGGDPEAEYLSDGTTETLINELSHLPNLTVKARSSVFRYKDKNASTRKIGEELSAEAVLLGRLARTGDELKMNVELVESSTDNVLWSKEYTRKVNDLVPLLRDIAKNLTEALDPELNFIESYKSPTRYTDNPEAYQAYLTGRFIRYQSKPGGRAKAFEYFKNATDLDPGFALAWVGLSQTYSANKTISPAEAAQNMRISLRKALELAPDLAEAHAEYGWLILNSDWDFLGSEKEFKLAIALNPNAPEGYFRYSWFLMATGRVDEAITECKKAEQLDPLNSLVNTYVGAWLAGARRNDEALAQLQKTIEINPEYFGAHQWLAIVLAYERRYDEALSEIQIAKTLSNVPNLLANEASINARAGRRDEAISILNALLERQTSNGDVPEADLAGVYTSLGEKEKAFEWLEKGLVKREYNMKWLRMFPFLDDLHNDPRFADLVQRLGLPH